LTAIRPAGGVAPGGSALWCCRCDCGEKTLAEAHKLKKKITLSCGCIRRDDLAGRRFGRLKAIEYVGRADGSGGTLWMCRCDCGNIITTRAYSLTSGHTESCGCLYAAENLTGCRFGMLIVTGPSKKGVETSTRWWKCRCDCGGRSEVRGTSLMKRVNPTKSCGCLRVTKGKRDLTGLQVNQLKVLGRAKGEAMWRVQCTCGTKKELPGTTLISGRTKSCGCSNKGARDFTGWRSGLVSVIKRAPDNGKGVRWHCKCDCGTRWIVSSHRLGAKTNPTRSCGCAPRPGRKRDPRALTRSRHYARWSAMKQRCYNPSAANYAIYGGRGIRVCREWKNDPEAFIRWCNSRKPRRDMTLDRKDNNKGYHPANCRFATASTQSKNQRRWKKRKKMRSNTDAARA